MEILKYLDVLIGLAVVMVLLSPLVSAITQVFVWLVDMRAGRLQVGLENLLLQLNASPYARFDAAEISGLPPNQVVLFAQPPVPPPPAAVPAPVAGWRASVAAFVEGIAARLKVPEAPPAVPVAAGLPIQREADANGNLTLTENVPAMLAAHGGILRHSLTLPTGAPLLAGAIRLAQRWTVTSAGTDASGDATAAYNFIGPSRYASREATASLAGGAALPAGSVLSISIASGAFKGTQLIVADNACSYPPSILLVPSVHELAIKLTPAPPLGTQVVLTFRRQLIDDGIAAAGKLTRDEAREVCAAVLLHPVIAQPQFWGADERKGEVVQREEFIRILLEFACDPTTIAGMTKARPMTLAAMQKLRQVLAGNDVPDPGRALADIRETAQVLELKEGGKPTHERLTKAILMSAQSSFVGCINNWFDQTMDRTTAEYKFRAQLVTVIAALLVATFVQLDSIDLLKRLSTDDKLRESLVKQAELQQKRLDDPGKGNPTQGEIQNAKSQRDEIQGNLAKLRDPQLAVLPDHFLWQPLPRGRLMGNRQWHVPYSQYLELVVGGSVYPLEPQWSSDPMSDIEAAVRNSGAPVTMARDSQRTAYIVTGNGVGKLRVNIGGIDRLSHVSGLVQAAVDSKLDPGNQPPAGTYSLLVGYDTVTITNPAAGVAAMRKAIETSKAPVSLLPESKPPTLVLQAAKPEARWIQLRQRAGDPASNVLVPSQFNGGAAHYDDRLFPGEEPLFPRVKQFFPWAYRLFEGAKQSCAVVEGKFTVSIGPCKADAVAAVLKAEPFAYFYKVDKDQGEHLLLTSKRLGPLQLRSVPGKPETNMLNSAEEWSCCFDSDLLSTSWRGVLLTWILLSLGAPFWYDALKDMLKLRSTLAKKEEDARVERQTAAPAK